MATFCSDPCKPIWRVDTVPSLYTKRYLRPSPRSISIPDPSTEDTPVPVWPLLSLIILSLTSTVCTFATKLDPFTVKSPAIVTLLDTVKLFPIVAFPEIEVRALTKLTCVSAAILTVEPVPVDVNAIDRLVPVVFNWIPPFDDDIITFPFVAVISTPTSDITWVCPVPLVDKANVWFESALILIVVSEVPKNGVSPI